MTDGMDRQRIRDWWRTSIIEMSPGIIRLRGYNIEELIGGVTFPEIVWLMLRGELPTAEQAALLEAAMVASVDHGPQSPAIAIARMAITSGNDLNHAMGSAVNVLGDTHGGAGQQCMELLASIVRGTKDGLGIEEAAIATLDSFRALHGSKIPGFGHRFHTVDPRSVRLLELVNKAVSSGHISGYYAAAACSVNSLLSQGRRKRIPLNIDGATAVIYCELGFDPPLGRGLFVLSRALGILSHAWEQSTFSERIKGPTPPDFLYTYEGPAARSLGSRRTAPKGHTEGSDGKEN